MSAMDTAESTIIDVSREPLDEVIRSTDSWLNRAVQRIQAEAAADPSAAVAAFNSSL